MVPPVPPVLPEPPDLLVLPRRIEKIKCARLKSKSCITNPSQAIKIVEGYIESTERARADRGLAVAYRSGARMEIARVVWQERGGTN
jgi:hypothetical protein